MTPHRGYIALIATFALTLILTALAIAGSFSGVMTRLNLLATENSWSAAHHARACTRVALLYVAQDPEYHPPQNGEDLSITDTDTCRITSIFPIDTGLYVRTEARVGESVQHIQAAIAIPAITAPYITNWEKL